MPEIKDLTGQKFGRLTVEGFSHLDKHHKGHWLCRCECGAAVDVETHQLKCGKTKSCGCWKNDVNSKRLKTHGCEPKRLYRVWVSMKKRCTNPKEPEYKNYGGRGITVCDEWRCSFESFRFWALVNGYEEGLSIDRIDNNGNYCPDNCRWTDRKTQNSNKRNNHRITFNGKTQTVTEWAEELKTSHEVICRRAARNWPLDKPLPRKGRPKGSKNKPKGDKRA